MDIVGYNKLVDDLRRWSYQYYVLDQPEISDAQYNLLFRSLLDWEEQNPDHVHPQSPSKSVAGGTRAMGVLLPHTVPMLSIDNIFSYEDYNKWIASLRRQLGYEPKMVAEFKYDGLAITLRYEQGRLVAALTRNDGVQGEDVTENVLAIGTIPTAIENFNGEIRGEIVVPKDIFERLNDSLAAAGQKTYANCRNAAAGMLRRKKTSYITHLAFIPYGIYVTGEEDPDGIRDMPYDIQRELLRKWVPCIIDAEDPACNLKGWMSDEDKFGLTMSLFDKKREDFPVDVDGVVLKVSDAKDIALLGAGNRVVNHMRAYKFNALNRQSVIREIRFQIGTTGLVTPVIEIEPVELNGVMVTKATAHNFEQLRQWAPRVGDYVAIERAGDVIPYITDVIPSASVEGSPEPLPCTCPVCATPLTSGRNSNGMYCPNADCTGRRVSRLLVVGSREALDIKGLGERTIELLLAKWPTLWIPELVALTVDDLRQAGLGAKDSENLAAEIAEKRHTTLRRALRAEQFESLGRTLSRRIEEDLMRNGMTSNILDELIWSIEHNPGASLYKYIEADPNWKARLQSLHALDIYREISSGVSDGTLADMRFSVTGSIPGTDRDKIVAVLRAQGAEFTSGVSKKTTVLFCGHDAGSKLTKARELGIKVVDLTDPETREAWPQLFT